MPTDHDIEFDKMTSIENEVEEEMPLSNCANPTDYCNNCSCGKKEKILKSKPKFRTELTEEEKKGGWEAE